MATVQEFLQQLSPAVRSVLFPQQDIAIEQIAQEIARQELLGGVEALPRNVFGRPTQDALLHQMNIANMLLQAGEIDDAIQRVESILPFIQGRTPNDQLARALQNFSTALIATQRVPWEEALRFAPQRRPGTYTLQALLDDYAWRSGLRGMIGMGIDPATGQPGILPQIMQTFSLAGMALPGTLTSPVVTTTQNPVVQFFLALLAGLADLLGIGEEERNNNQ